MAESAAVTRESAHGKQRFRGMGRGRKTRRALDRGGIGPARALNATLGAWDGVRITPMFGRWGYFVGARLFACFPLRDKDHDLWIRLSPSDQPRALREAGVRPHRRFAQRGWIEVMIESEADVPRALRWLRRAWNTATNAVGTEDEAP
jgi:predicted DNA-binding protein (MmcQ/YjbR family)